MRGGVVEKRVLGIGVVSALRNQKHVRTCQRSYAFDGGPSRSRQLVFVRRKEKHELHHVAEIQVKHGTMRCLPGVIGPSVKLPLSAKMRNAATGQDYQKVANTYVRLSKTAASCPW